MEESRLKTMPAVYDRQLFNDLYKQTNALKRKLASGIDLRRFNGIEYDDLLSWFDIKFIFVFNKYHDKVPENILLGTIINSLKMFKCRILRKAYTVQFSQSIIGMDYVDHEIIAEEETSYHEHYRGLLNDFMEKHLSPDALLLHDLTMNPPPYVLRRLNELEIDNQNKLPIDLILEYFDLSSTPNSIRFIEKLQSEIKEVIKLAKYHFRGN